MSGICRSAGFSSGTCSNNRPRSYAKWPAAPEPSDRIGSEERVPSELRVRQRGVEEEGPSTALHPTKQSDRVLPTDRTNGEPQALRHRRGIDREHLRLWVVRPGPKRRKVLRASHWSSSIQTPSGSLT